MRCSIFGCNSDNQSKKNPVDAAVKFFKFPKDIELVKKWVHATGRKDKFNVKTARVCSRHFSNEDYKDNLKQRLLNYSPANYRGLKENAIPNQNLPLPLSTSSHSPGSSSSGHDRVIKKKEQRNLVNKLLDVGDEENNVTPSCSGMTVTEMTISCEAEKGTIAFTLDKENVSDADTNKWVQTQMTASEIDLLKIASDEKEKEILRLKKRLLAVEKVFSKNQILKLQSSKRIQWSVAEVSSAITLYAAGPRAYRLMLKKGFPYPAVSTLRAWLRKIKIKPGILRNVFKLVESSDFNKKDRVCTLLFDEMKIKKEYIYDRAEDETLKPFSYSQVVMMNGLLKSWKQPIFFDYDMKMTADKLQDIIKFVQSSGFQVVAIVCDLGGGNRGLHNELKITYSRPYFTNQVNGENIYVFADVPHLLKLVRNHFVDQGFIIHGKEISKSIVEATLDATAVSDLKITHKITKDQLNVSGAQRQRVKYAAKLFSHTISRAISRCGTLGYLSEEMNWAECSEFFKLVNDWFDIFNVSVPVSDSRTRNRAYGLQLEEQDEILNRMSEEILSLRVKGRNSLLPFQNGILMSNNALKMLLPDLKRRLGTEYILTRRLNQDVLENFFGIIRAKGGLHDHPNALEFKYRLRTYIMGRNEGAFSEFSNVELDDTPDLPITASIINTFDSRDEPLLIKEKEVREDIVSELHELEYDGLENLAGFICFKLKDPSCEFSGQSSFTWVDHLSEGGLHKPSVEFLAQMEELENIFTSVNGDTLLVTKNYLENLISKSTHVTCSDKAKNLFFRSRMYFRIKELNRSLTKLTLGKRKMTKIAT